MSTSDAATLPMIVAGIAIAGGIIAAPFESPVASPLPPLLQPPLQLPAALGSRLLNDASPWPPGPSRRENTTFAGLEPVPILLRAAAARSVQALRRGGGGAMRASGISANAAADCWVVAPPKLQLLEPGAFRPVPGTPALVDAPILSMSGGDRPGRHPTRAPARMRCCSVLRLSAAAITREQGVEGVAGVCGVFGERLWKERSRSLVIIGDGCAEGGMLAGFPTAQGGGLATSSSPNALLRTLAASTRLLDATRLLSCALWPTPPPRLANACTEGRLVLAPLGPSSRRTERNELERSLAPIKAACRLLPRWQAAKHSSGWPSAGNVSLRTVSNWLDE